MALYRAAAPLWRHLGVRSGRASDVLRHGGRPLSYVPVDDDISGLTTLQREVRSSVRAVASKYLLE